MSVLPLLVIIAAIVAMAGVAHLVRFKGEHQDRGM